VGAFAADRSLAEWQARAASLARWEQERGSDPLEAPGVLPLPACTDSQDLERGPAPASWPGTCCITSTRACGGSAEVLVDASGPGGDHRRLQRRDSPGARSGAVPRDQVVLGAFCSGRLITALGAEGDRVCRQRAGQPAAGCVWSERRCAAAGWAGAVAAAPDQGGAGLAGALVWRPARALQSAGGWAVWRLQQGSGPSGRGPDQ